ncbi:MAG: hypothetical protein QOD81_292 [Solirubrobacteraceae bacterium]|nr:hypothetical protein [Solirubrobacteraceae bacterium]
MSDLLSKVLAGGLSAGIFLLWWPAHAPAQGAEWLIVRGVLWTLAFEILLLAFCPLERMVARAVRARRVHVAAPRRAAGALVLATAGLAVPFALLQGVQAQVAQPARAATPTKVIVKREIVRREIVVRRVSKIVPVTAPAATTPVAGPPTSAVRSTAARASTTPEPTTKRSATADAVVATGAARQPTQSTSVPAAKTPAATVAPAAPAAAAQPPATATAVAATPASTAAAAPSATGAASAP